MQVQCTCEKGALGVKIFSLEYLGLGLHVLCTQIFTVTFLAVKPLHG